MSNINLYLRKNYKLELGLILFGLFFMLTWRKHPESLQLLEGYFTDMRCLGMVSFFAITIGIYILFWSVVATSMSKINKKILEEKIDKELFFVTTVNIIESFLAIFFCLYIPDAFPLHTSLSLTLAAVALVSFIKFIATALRYSLVAIKFTIKDIDSKN